jgi:hypothetical protein
MTHLNPFQWLQWLIEYMGGARDEGPPGLKMPVASPLWGVLWVFLLTLILIFGGQSSKFIYIDF